MASNLTLRQLRYFVAVAHAQQISLAAIEENVSQSTISNGVIAIEEELGVRLFDRLPQGVALTSEGQDFLRHAKHILESVRDAVESPRFKEKTLSGTVRIAASYTLLGYFLPEQMARFRASYPDVEIHLQDMNRRDVEDAVLAGEVDIGIVILSNVQQQSRFEHAVLVRSRRQLWVAPNHPLAQIRSPSLKDIAEFPYLLLTTDEGEHSALDYWKKNRLHPNIVMRTGSIEALRGLVGHGFGVTVLSDMVFRPWSLEGKRIEARPVFDMVPHMDAGMLWKRQPTFSEAAQAFQQFLIQSFGI
ncbi:LysR substrate-binding domain-containing protein [Glaciimonas sp. Gout2]|uniref:LysR substrate-binding domain-containing protein n=2 Tax=Glaciimonas TaxID=1229970 RepID=UPI002AB489DA|nr:MULTISPECIES: LysR substrate-binding domain-containing protein [unclassified Glaciimonas]MDY7548975.1 LysR substrate-binding domain-containing protein [Glaciimonas sp. CA11.2]MEB0013674.1 LysR substrate-binding domain-containing protein [Glaciimonas sp. Cout2]MEB0084589.1 LysR substrate-binding domain-containing protein [Glaciimonas sp. Gout2]